MILECGCGTYKGNTSAAEYQDCKYGAGMRVHNLCASTDGGTKYRCTICEREKSQGGVDKKKKRR